MASSVDLIKQLEAVHLAFHVGAIDKLYPGLGPEERDRAVARERQRDSAYLDNMRRRVREGFTAAQREPGLSAQQRGLEVAQVAAREVRYLQQHVKAATWRLQSESSISQLKAQGEEGAYWQLGENTNHCPTCRRMGNRWWPWTVLDRVNPAVTHPGCHCRLRSRAQAEREGLQVVVGRHTPSVAQLDLNEAAAAMALELFAESDRARANGHAATVSQEHSKKNPGIEECLIPLPEPNGNGHPKETPGKPQESSCNDKAERNDRICELWLEEGLSQSAIGREIGLSQPRVRRILLDRFGEEALRTRGRSGTRHDLATVR